MLKVKLLTDTAALPTRANPGDVGLDLYADETVILFGSGHRRPVRTGIAVEIPTGYVGSVRPRSGLAFDHGITVLNAPGTIDPGYRGEVKVLLVNHGSHNYEIQQGHRIAQLVLELCASPDVVPVDALSASERGADGLGSTGA